MEKPLKPDMKNFNLSLDTTKALGQISPNALDPVAPTLRKDLQNFGLPLYSQSRVLTATEFKQLQADVYAQIAKFDAKRKLPYHNLSHTKAVIKRILQLAKQAKLKSEEKQLIQIAGLFHDYIHGAREFSQAQNNSFEQQSATVADKILRSLGYSIVQRVQVYALIISTTFANEKIRPYTLLEKLLVCADLGGFNNSEKGWLRESLSVTLEASTIKRPKTFMDWLNQQEKFLQYAKDRLPKEALQLKWQDKLKQKHALLQSLKKNPHQYKSIQPVIREIEQVLQ